MMVVVRVKRYGVGQIVILVNVFKVHLIQMVVHVIVIVLVLIMGVLIGLFVLVVVLFVVQHREGVI